ncbi:MAG: hypothetical protein KGZ97_13840 [Bacteroidetes bacterium]|nr:hypothetical protein [Bacteroidota bacterium]
MNQSKSKIRIDISFILFLIFLIASVALSFNLNEVNKKLKNKPTQEKGYLEYQISMLNEVFLLNYDLNGTVVQSNSEIVDEYLNKYKELSVLYLKQDACSECYNRTIRDVIKKLSNKETFLIISHPTNKTYLEGILETKELFSKNKIIFSSSNLYSNSSTSHINSVLLIIGSNKQIRLYLSMDFLKDDYFFNVYISFLENNI